MYPRQQVRIAWPPFPPVTKALMIANGAVYLMTVFSRLNLTSLLGMVPAYFHDAERVQVWGVFTYMFMHGSLSHLVLNMMGLWMFGSAVEAYWGSGRFLRFYLLCGVSAGLAYPLLDWNSTIPLVGASGAIFGVLAAYGMIWPDRRLYLMGLAPLKAKWVVVIFGAFSFFAMIGDRRSGIAHFAHLAGLLAGVGLILWSRRGGGGGGFSLELIWRRLRRKKTRRFRVHRNDEAPPRYLGPPDDTLH